MSTRRRRMAVEERLSEGEKLTRFSMRDGMALGLGLVIGLIWVRVFGFESLLSVGGLPGWGLLLFTAAALCSEAAYLGWDIAAGKKSLFLTSAAAAVSIGAWVTGNGMLRLMSTALLALVLPMAALSLSGGGRSWREIGAVWDTVSFIFPALFRAWPVPFQAAAGRRGKWKSAAAALVGLLAAAVVMAVILPMLSSADQVFGWLLSGAAEWMEGLDIGSALWKIMRTLIFTLIFFSILYTLAHPRDKGAGSAPQAAAQEAKSQAGSVVKLGVTVFLSMLDIVYMVLAAVQVVYLFGGAETAAMSGGYAQYARSGFFQLVAVAAINAAVVLAAAKAAGSKVVKGLSLSMCILTLVILASALTRMCLYIGAYGLSLLRLMTLWAMAFILVCLAAGALKCLKRDFKFWPVFFAAGVWGWAIFTIMAPDYLVAKYNVDMYLSGKLDTVDVVYISQLSPAARKQLLRIEDIEDMLGDSQDMTWE